MSLLNSIKSITGQKPLISVVIPCYKCSESIKELYNRLVLSLEKIDSNYEIIFINDASPKNDWEVISQISSLDKKIKGVNLSRNFGEYYAITAGIDFAKGKWIVIMDGDLQDSPEEIEKLYSKAKEGFDIVYARRSLRQDNILKKLSSKLFYKVFSFLTGTQQDESINNFGIYSQCAIENIRNMREKSRFFPVMIKWIGFNSTCVDVKHCSRKHGETSYNFKKLFNLAFDTMIAFSDKPLRLTVQIGFFIVMLALTFAVYIFIKYLFGYSSVKGWPSLMVSIWFFSGLIVMILGIIGIYIGKIFDEVKKRPIYIVKDVLNIRENE